MISNPSTSTRKSRNACAIVKGQKFVYFENYPFGIAHIKREVNKADW